MKLITPAMQWVYLKNYQFDKLPSRKRDMVFFTSLSIGAGIYFTLQIIGLFFNIYFLGPTSTLLFCGMFVGGFLFRFPYMNGKMYRFKPDFLKQKPSTSRKVTTPNNWKLPYLRILGLPITATPEQIKIAYRKMAMKYHPDRNSAPNAEAAFKKIKEAYEKLTA